MPVHEIPPPSKLEEFGIMIALAVVTLIVGGGIWLAFFNDDTPAEEAAPTVTDLLANRVQDHDAVWCEGMAAGQVLIGDALGLGKPTGVVFGQIIATCLESGYPSQPLTGYTSDSPSGGSGPTVAK